MQGQYNMRSPAVKRLMKEAQELKDPTELFYAQPLEDNLFEWHFTIRGPGDTEFDGGIFHGRIVLPPDYPMKPPSIIILTPNGRFEVNKKICLSISGHHPESWQPSWSIRTALLAIIGFMPTHGAGAIGSLDYTSDERKVLSKKSQSWKCHVCGNLTDVLKPVTDASKKTSQEAKDLASQIDFQGEKGDKSNNGQASAASANATISSSTTAPSQATSSTAACATAAVTTTTTSAAGVAAGMTPPHMTFPSPMNMAGMPAMFHQAPPFFPPMAGQFPFPFRFPYPPTSTDQNTNSMPNCQMMPPFPNPFMPPMFPSSFGFPQPGGSDGQGSSTTANMSPFPFPFMPTLPPTVPAATTPLANTSTPSLSSATVSATNSTSSKCSSSGTSTATQVLKSTAVSPSSVSSTSSAPSSTSSPSTTVKATAAGSSLTDGTGVKSKTKEVPTSGGTIDHSLSNGQPSPSLPADTAASPPTETSSAASVMGMAAATVTTALPSATTITTFAGGTANTTTSSDGTNLRQRTTTTSSTTTTPATPTPTAGVSTAPNVASQSAQSRGTASFVLMVLLGLAILLLCLRRLYVSIDPHSYSDYTH